MPVETAVDVMLDESPWLTVLGVAVRDGAASAELTITEIADEFKADPVLSVT